MHVAHEQLSVLFYIHFAIQSAIANPTLSHLHLHAQSSSNGQVNWDLILHSSSHAALLTALVEVK